jgi:hypothetical protein
MLLSPLEAANRVNEQVTVEMTVRAAKNCPHCSQSCRGQFRVAAHAGLHQVLRGVGGG